MHGYGYGIAADAEGNAYVTGHVLSANFPVMNPLPEGNRGASDAFVTQLSPKGAAPLFSTYLGERKMLRTTFEVGHLATGVYFVKIEDGEKVTVRTLIKK